jgi:hypothetical protein
MDNVVKLDTALCNRHIREQVVQLLTAAVSVFRSSRGEQRFLDRRYLLTRMLQWLDRRRLRLDGVVLSSSNDMYLAEMFLLGAHTEWLAYEIQNSTSIDHFGFFNTVLPACCNLKRLYLCGRLDDSWMKAVATHCPLLQLIDFPSYGVRTNDDTFLQFCRGCPQLEHLNMGYVSGLTEEGFLAGVANLPKLTCLKYYSKEELQLESLTAIGRACPRINTFRTRLTSDQSVLQYSHCFPHLTSLCPYSFLVAGSDRSALTLSGYFEGVRACPCITELDIPRALPLDVAGEILRSHHSLVTLTVDVYLSRQILELVAQHCPLLQHLTVWSYYTSQEVTRELDGLLLDVAAACPHLHTLVFSHYGTITAGGLVACAERCPALRHVQLFFHSPQLDVSALKLVSQLVPRLFITAPKYSVSKYALCM